jgi:hypothetical protein
MDGMENTGVNGGQVADVQSTQSNDTPAQDTGVNNSSTPAESKPMQDDKTNAAFAEMRRAREAAEQKAAQVERDFNYFAKYNNLGVKTEAELKAQYGNQGINSWEDVDRYYEAQDKNIDPDLYREIIESKQTAQQALDKLSKYEQKELMQRQAEELSKDSRWGSFFNANRDEIMGVANQFGVDLNTARLLVLDQKYQEPDNESLKQTAVKEYLEKVKSGNAPVESGGNTAVLSGSSTPKTFEEARKQAMAYLRGIAK